jgi:hypothetical protein
LGLSDLSLGFPANNGLSEAFGIITCENVEVKCFSVKLNRTLTGNEVIGAKLIKNGIENALSDPIIIISAGDNTGSIFPVGPLSFNPTDTFNIIFAGDNIINDPSVGLYITATAIVEIKNT